MKEQKESEVGALSQVVQIIDRYWKFDEAQQHTHSWHDKQDCLDELRKLFASEKKGVKS